MEVRDSRSVLRAERASRAILGDVQWLLGYFLMRRSGMSAKAR
jgi:hypothetical protein